MEQKTAEISTEKILEICIDIDFDNYMNFKERKSLIDQVRHCYSYNRKSEKPCSLIVTGCTEKSWAMLKNRNAKQWKTKYIELYKQPIEEILDIENSVYLTADAEEIIQEFDIGTTYIIGGIVDKNRHKNLCLDKAKKLGMRVARLPILENVDLCTSTVLTVNQVFGILIEQNKTESWDFLKEQLIPERRRDDQ